MSCHRQHVPAAICGLIEEITGEKVTQADWHGLVARAEGVGYPTGRNRLPISRTFVDLNALGAAEDANKEITTALSAIGWRGTDGEFNPVNGKYPAYTNNMAAVVRLMTDEGAQESLEAVRAARQGSSKPSRSTPANCLHNDPAQCGNCGKAWCATCDPGPGAMCPFCNGVGHSTAEIKVVGGVPKPPTYVIQGEGYAVDTAGGQYGDWAMGTAYASRYMAKDGDTYVTTEVSYYPESGAATDPPVPPFRLMEVVSVMRHSDPNDVGGSEIESDYTYNVMDDGLMYDRLEDAESIAEHYAKTVEMER